MFGKAFKTRSHYVFNYQPRYYNAKKERLEKLEEKYAGEQNENDSDIPTINFGRNNLKQAWKKSKTVSSDNKSTKRLAIIITILVGIAAYILDFHSLF